MADRSKFNDDLISRRPVVDDHTIREKKKERKHFHNLEMLF